MKIDGVPIRPHLTRTKKPLPSQGFFIRAAIKI